MLRLAIIIYYNTLAVYQINFMYPANAFIYCVCGRENFFWGGVIFLLFWGGVSGLP